MEEEKKDNKGIVRTSETACFPKMRKEGWGVEGLPYPAGLALIQARWDLCIGCGMCEVACPA